MSQNDPYKWGMRLEADASPTRDIRNKNKRLLIKNLTLLFNFWKNQGD